MTEMFPHLKQRSPVVNSFDWTLIWKDTHLSIQVLELHGYTQLSELNLPVSLSQSELYTR